MLGGPPPETAVGCRRDRDRMFHSRGAQSCFLAANTARDASGLGLLVVACAVAGALLIVNRLVVSSVYAALVPSALDYPKLRTFVAMLAIAGLLIPEWWLIDVASARFRRSVQSLRASRHNVPR